VLPGNEPRFLDRSACSLATNEDGALPAAVVTDKLYKTA
jgi:hypothetical protein